MPQRQRQEGVGMPGTFYKLLEIQCGKDQGFPSRESKNLNKAFCLLVNIHDFLGKEFGLSSEIMRRY